MKKHFPLEKMSVQEMDALDINREQYKMVFEFIKTYKISFVKIEIKQFENEFFYGLNYLFTAGDPYNGKAFLYNSHAFDALRKWGTYTSLEECKKAALKEIETAAQSEKEKYIISKLGLQDILTMDKEEN